MSNVPLPKVFPPVFTLFFAGGMWLLASYLPIFELISSPWNRLGYLLIGIAMLLDLWSLGLFFKADTTFHPLKLHQTSSLVTSGMYKVTRNPMYLGLALILTGWAIVLSQLTPFFMLPLFVWLINAQQIQHEERVLEEKFGDIYREYKQRVRRWF